MDIKKLLLRGPSNIKEATDYGVFIRRNIKEIKELTLSNDDKNIIFGHMNTAKSALVNRNANDIYFDVALDLFDN